MGWNFTLLINNTLVVISNAPSIDTALFFEPEQFWKVDNISNGITLMCNDTAAPEEGDRMSTTEVYSANISIYQSIAQASLVFGWEFSILSPRS